MKHVFIGVERPENNKIQYSGMVIRDPAENWLIDVTSSDKNGDFELTEIKIKLPTGKTWAGTIQDFMAIFNIVQNAFNAIEYDLDLKECKAELEHILSCVK